MMPYMSVGKKVFKKLPGGKKGKMVGKTKGSVKKYMAAVQKCTRKLCAAAFASSSFCER